MVLQYFDVTLTELAFELIFYELEDTYNFLLTRISLEILISRFTLLVKVNLLPSM